VSVEQFFRASTSARPLGVARAAVGIAAFVRALIQYKVLRLLLSGQVIRVKPVAWLPDLAPEYVSAFIGIWLILCVAFALGFRTRISGSLLCVCLAYQLAMDANLDASNLYFMVLTVLLLTVGDSGCSFSIDRLLFRNDPQEVARWSTLLPRLQVSIIYSYSVLLKLNPRFLNGDAIVIATRLPGPLHSTWLPTGAAVATVCLEFFLAWALWVPALRRAAFTLGFLFHLVIFFSMDGGHTTAMFTFGLNMLAPYLLFLEQRPASRLVVWDDNCSFCRRWIAVCRKLDWLGIHRYEGSSNPATLQEAGVTPQEADAELKLSFDGHTIGGFDAVREILCLLPISFLWAHMLALPPISGVGRRLYRRVAERRKCDAVV
jgi:predicted DCC family thiol-disulfide oxidoreductase YuxK